ncbi:MAG: sensor histidine kinase [Candidatus Adiutrix sp.]
MFDYEAISRFDILNLFGRERLENIQKILAKATGLAMVTLDYKGERLTEMTEFTPFCQEMRQGDLSAQLCRTSDVYGAGQALGRQNKFIYCCPCGLWEVAIPIIVKNHYLGCFFAGQVRCDNAPAEAPLLGKLFEDQLSKCRLNSRQKKLYKNIPSYDYSHFVHLAELISLVIAQVAGTDMLNQTVSNQLKGEISDLKEQIKILEAELSLRKSEVIKFKSKLNYYFLINTLNSISNLAVIEDSPRTNEMIILFAEHLRHGLPAHKNFVLLAEEVDNIERYLKMHKIRFGDLLTYSINLSPELTMRKAPAHVIMPFVEKAVFYGLATRESRLEVMLSVTTEGPDIVIVISDDGPGLTDEELSVIFAPFQNGYEGEAIQMGVLGASQRLGELFGQEYSLEIKTVAGRGTENILRFPSNLSAGVL